MDTIISLSCIPTISKKWHPTSIAKALLLHSYFFIISPEPMLSSLRSIAASAEPPDGPGCRTWMPWTCCQWLLISGLCAGRLGKCTCHQLKERFVLSIRISCCCSARKSAYEPIGPRQAAKCALKVLFETMHGSVRPPHMHWGQSQGKQGPCRGIDMEFSRIERQPVVEYKSHHPRVWQIQSKAGHSCVIWAMWGQALKILHANRM